MVFLAFWSAGQFFITKAYTLLVFAGIFTLFHGIDDIIKAFMIRRVGRLWPPEGTQKRYGYLHSLEIAAFYIELREDGDLTPGLEMLCPSSKYCIKSP